MSSPRVTVACCNRNGASTLAESISTALAQDCSDLEVLLIDDGSTDDSVAIMRRIADVDARVRVVELASHRGLAAARNVAVEEASSDCLAFIDADDLWRRSKISRQLAAMTGDVGLVGCFSAVLDGEGAVRGWRLGRDFMHVAGDLPSGDAVSGGSVALLRVAALRSAGGFDESLSWREDWDMWLRLARVCRLRTVPEVLVGYRRGGGGMSSDYWQMVDGGRQILRKVAAVDPRLAGRDLDRALADDLAGIGGLAMIDGSYDAARELYRAAAKISRLSLQRTFVRAVLASGGPGHRLLERVPTLMAQRWVGVRAGEAFALD